MPVLATAPAPSVAGNIEPPQAPAPVGESKPGVRAVSGDVFQVKAIASNDGTPARTVLAADRRQIDCLFALRELCGTMNWNLAIESTPLENDLRFASVDLNLSDQDPRMVAHLIAVAGGADSIIDEPGGFEGARVTLHVVRIPSAKTESGRQRLRSIAGQWYRSFLRDELQYEPVVQQQAVAVRMHLGSMLIESGDLQSAIAFFDDVYEQRPNDQVAASILRIAECHLDLAAGFVDRESQLREYEAAEKWLRRIFDGMPSAPEITPATILLGRALLGKAEAQADTATRQELARACQAELRARIIRLMDSVELLHVWLLAGHAQLLMGQPDQAYRTMLTLRESPYFDDLGPDQFLDYHYLLGYGALGTDHPELAMRAIEWFLIHAEDDPRRGQAYVMLAESYLSQKRFVQARAASVEARERFLARLSPEWRQRALRIWARAALSLGEKEGAFVELERLVLRGEEPELTLFLIDELLADRQWQRAIAVGRAFADREGPIGDRARFKTVRALFEQAVAGDNLDDFPSQAIAIAPKVSDTDLRSQIATMIGEAYMKLGKLEHAADAYRGILR
ncbi:MAG: tetratricopeptide repeat protein [Planctomycetota bacterium]